MRGAVCDLPQQRLLHQLRGADPRLRFRELFLRALRQLDRQLLAVLERLCLSSMQLNSACVAVRGLSSK